MITLCILLLLLVFGVVIVGAILLGAGAIVLDVLIGISPFLLIYFICKKIKEKRDGQI